MTAPQDTTPLKENAISRFLLGDPATNRLEDRIFNAVSLIGAGVGMAAIVTNIFLGIPGIQTLACLVLILITLTAYWLSRISKITFLIKKIVLLALLGLIFFFWFGSGGLMGGAPHLFFILLVATVIVIPKRSRIFFILLELLAVGILLIIIERFIPSTLAFYNSPDQHFYDTMVSFFFSVIFVVIMVYIVFKQYFREKESKEKLLDQAIRDKEAMEKAFHEIKQLRGIIPICAVCKKIRNDEGYWEQVEQYIHEHTKAEFSHGLCPTCAKEMYKKD
jgi:hypothetical protein